MQRARGVVGIWVVKNIDFHRRYGAFFQMYNIHYEFTLPSTSEISSTRDFPRFDTRLSRDSHKKIRQKSNFEIFEKRPKKIHFIKHPRIISPQFHDCTCVHKKTPPFLRKKVKKFAKNPILRFLKFFWKKPPDYVPRLTFAKFRSSRCSQQ